MDPNKRIHIFGNPRHNLAPLLVEFGDEEAAFAAMQAAVDAALARGELSVDARGRYRSVVDIGRCRVTVRGAIVDGVARIGSAWMRP
jgi:hypothetical protein